jgi:cation:H+ antiporter
MLLFAAGFALLVGGAELLVRGASRLAVAVGLSPLVVGLTVVSLGPSSPEIAVSLMACLNGQGDLALGNVVGSNVFNTLFILGICALVAPLVVAVKLVRFDVPVMIGASLVVYLMALDGRLGRVDGVLLSLGLVAYNVHIIRQSRRETRAATAGFERSFGPEPSGSASAPFVRALRNVGLIVVGLVLLVVGSRWLVDGAVSVATALGVSELVIGLTVVAAGTGLPEVATSVVASLRGERDIAVGNVVGSNIYNLLGVFGIAGLISAEGVPVAPGAEAFDLPVMIAAAVACLPVFFSGYRIHRWEGGLFLAYYAAYTAFLVLRAQEHDALPLFSRIMATYVLPLTAVTLAVIGWHGWRVRGRKA